ncbi:MAG TPA: tRNA threonylcarbamoyladenosine dehydratase [Bacteroidaceae bacterium]|nr:tRNA threonylcarbamoyladenosine dehydratase [Bacteroidaceae bacterium]
MMWNERTALLLGEDQMQRLTNSHVLVVGVGGVGAYAAEMLVRAGLGQITIVDADKIHVSNINRQLPALHSNIDSPKVDTLGARLMDINPQLKLTKYQLYIRDEKTPELLQSADFDFIVDAIDTIAPKVYLIAEAIKRKIKIISSMGAGAKRDITKIQFAKLKDTYHCGLSRQVRKRLRAIGIKHHKIPVVFSSEPADPKAVIMIDDEQNKKSTCGTISYMPAVFGCYLAEYVLRKLTTTKSDKED